MRHHGRPTKLAAAMGSVIHACLIISLVFGELGYVPAARAAETPTEPAPAEEAPKLTADELQTLVGPIAL